jgi:peroxiredoxin
MLKRFLLTFSLAIPVCGHCQSYADSPFYRKVSGVPSTAHVEGWAPGLIKTNGIVIDLSESVPRSSPDIDEIHGWSVHSWVDRNKPAHIFHYYLQYDQLNIVFGYDLRVEAVKDTDEIKVTFGTLTDPDELAEFPNAWPRDKGLTVVPLPGDLSPFMIRSGGVIAITTLPLGEGRIRVDHYLRLTRTDLTPDPESARLDAETSTGPDDSRIDLLKRIEQRFKNANTFDVKGSASAVIPGSSWRETYEFETQGAQPAFLPSSVRSPFMRELSTFGKHTETQIKADATDPKPQHFVTIPMGQYADIARGLIDAQKIGTENITFQGHLHSCEVIDAVYDVSPKFKPNSQTMHKRLSIDPSELLVLRETRSTPDGTEWTGDVTSISFDQPPSESMVQALQRFANQQKDRPDWVGRSIPDLNLAQLSGSTVNLAELRGKPILLDFWGSYCGPCRRTTLHAQELAKQFKSSGLIVLTLTQDTSQDAKLWTDYNHISLPVLLDPEGAAFKAFEVQGVPVTILVDENGRVAHYWVGLENLSAMDTVLNAMLHSH